MICEDNNLGLSRGTRSSETLAGVILYPSLYPLQDFTLMHSIYEFEKWFEDEKEFHRLDLGLPPAD
jgi:hypothetical protein